MRLFIIAIVAATVGYTLSVLINSVVSAETLVGFGIEVSVGDRLQMVATEWTGLASTYLPIYLGLHVVVFLLANHFLPLASESPDSHSVSRRIIFASAGALSLLLVYIGFDMAMGLSGVLVASGRTLGGLIVQVGTGAVSGLIFAVLTESSRKPEASEASMDG